MVSIVSTQTFERSAKRLKLKADEWDQLVLQLSDNPALGDLIPGGGGARKLRLARSGGGKRGGYRVVTFFGGGDIPVYLMDIYAKSEKSDLDPDGLKAIRDACKALLASHRDQRL
ncbi:MAG TPA: addiction module toxin RelE [Alphaproteobacteria bacterium]|nr:addiction module toxin RelE [Alphaproteobacteria bacterium]HAJ47525.1 addiction module toxin RelE [Alphaproteobacteria bacterium]